ncbi:hypothetical protein Nepgr_007954 [Nepenthes gracilis]|uniref:Uncharacterized protein n=1 Tax=Nepenthes gracilis TaxID=150966 RepID=A0AAD3S872_NEPGR|nr:hypothetical protein Nepgr_007954 [Nepenthes gracilis]
MPDWNLSLTWLSFPLLRSLFSVWLNGSFGFILAGEPVGNGSNLGRCNPWFCSYRVPFAFFSRILQRGFADVDLKHLAAGGFGPLGLFPSLNSSLGVAETVSVLADVLANVGPNGVQKETVSSTHSSHAAPDALQGMDQYSAQLVLGNPICDTDQIDGFQDSRPSFVECLANGVDLDLTPSSIMRLSSKYSLDDSIHVEPASVSPRGSLDGDLQGGAQEALQVGLNPLALDDLVSLDSCPTNWSSMYEEAVFDFTTGRSCVVSEYHLALLVFGHDASMRCLVSQKGFWTGARMLVWVDIDDGRWAVILFFEMSSMLPKACSLFLFYGAGFCLSVLVGGADYSYSRGSA